MDDFCGTINTLQFDPKLRGEKTEIWVKLLIGLPSIVGIVLLVWAPLLIYSLIQVRRIS